MADKPRWRLISNPQGDTLDVVAYGAAVAEGRIAGKYQLSTTLVPDTLIVQRSRERGIIAGADVTVDRDAAAQQKVNVARLPRLGRNSARPVGTLQLSELTSRASRNFKTVAVDVDDPAVLIYTSGTTGSPKGAMITHRNFHFQCDTIVRSLVEFTHNDRVIGVLPLYHIYGLANTLVVTIHYGASLSLIPQYSPQSLLDTIEKHKATIMLAIPSMYQLLLGLAKIKSRSSSIPQSLKYCISGGAPLSLVTLQQFSELFQTQIMEGYGLTESTSSVCANGKGGHFKEGSIGTPGTGVEMKVVDEAGAEAAPGTEGEIYIRSATIFKGYWNNPQASSETLKDGWLATGDLAYKDEDGYYFITDRKKDIIITHGYNISPREVEEVLLQHPQILEVAVVNRIGDKGDETVTAFVVAGPAEGQPALTEKDIKEFCSLHLAPYKHPRAFQFVDSLPKTATGKILRRELRGDKTDQRLIERSDS